MNLREGTRRLALLLGVVGAIVGAFASYVELQTVLSQRARHNRFEQLAASDTVKNERNSWSLTLRYAPKEAIEALRKLPEGQQRNVLRSLTQEERVDLLEKLKCAPSQWGVDSTDTVQGNLSQVDRFADYQKPANPPVDYDALAKKYGGTKEKTLNDPYACLAESSNPPPSIVNEGDIKTIHWTKVLGVESIETEDGQTLYPTSAPPAWEYFLIALLPILGFLIPWGAVRAIGWVGAGFVQPSK
jgi:hypothetical protein